MDLHPGPEKHRVPESRAEVVPLQIQQAFHENQEWYQDLVEHSQDLLWVHDLSGRLLSVNSTPSRLLGYSVDEILQIPLRELVAPESRTQFDDYLKEIASAGEANGFLAVLARSGERRIWEYHNTLVKSAHPAMVRGIARDLTEQRHTEGLLQDASGLNRQIITSTNEGVAVYDRNLRCIAWNPFMEEMTGTPASEALGKAYEELVPPGVKKTDRLAELNPALQGHTVTVADEMIPGIDGSQRWFATRACPLRNAQGEITGVIMTLRDITVRKQAEVALRESEQRQQTIAKQLETERARLIEAQAVAKVGSWEAELPSLEVTWSEQTHRIFETDPSHYHPTRPDFVKSVHPEDRAKVEAAFEASLEKPAPSKVDYRIVMADGRVKVLEERWKVFHNEQGRPVRLMGTCLDITERKRAEERLREYERAVEGSKDMIVVLDREYRFVIANREYLKYRCLESEQVIGHAASEIIGKETFETVARGKMDECFRGQVVEYERKYTYPVLGERDLSLSYFPIQGATGVDRIACILRDITERKQAEERLREYERVVEGFEEMCVVIDRDYRYVIANRAFLNRRGWEQERLIGRNVLIQWAADGASEEIIAIAKQKMDECFQGKVVEYELRYTYPRLGERDLLSTYFPIEGAGGVDRIACILRDITERKKIEAALRRSEEGYRKFVSQSTEGIFRMDLDAPVRIDLPEDELIHHHLHDNYMAECNDAMAAMYGLKSGEEMRGKRLSELATVDDPCNIELTREFIRSGFRVLDRESHEVDIHGNPKIILNSMIGTVENGMIVHTWGIQRDITEKVKAEEARGKAEESLRQNVAQLQQVTEQLREAQEKLAEEKLYLEEAIDTELGFGEIIGRSSALTAVMEKVARVAPSDAPVLLLGETGTGKELVARALHRLSKRHGNSFIKLNCAAIPSGLLESELFGHEKGAFTGAVARKLGRLELADKGTLFLDEIGEISLSLQPKLLRVLQDQEFERLGSAQTLKVNFRLLAATNRDLLQSVKAHEFRSDLYYRLNVFPILIPPLRERREDIRALIEHFVRKFAAQMKKLITSVPSKTMETLVRWDWPGNIRELENFVERSVILTSGSVLQAPLSELQMDVDSGAGSDSLRDKDRQRILTVLRECKGKLGGPDGAAARLGLKRTTLQSKLDHLGIKPGTYRNLARG